MGVQRPPAYGQVMFNNGWGGCRGWTQCNVAEVATHEIGHTIGFGHSGDSSATMAAYAHFDGRCGSLRADDMTGAQFIYPETGLSPTPTRTLTPTRTATPTQAPTSTFTRTLVPTATATPTQTSPPTVTPTTAGGGTVGLTGTIRYYANGTAVSGAVIGMSNDPLEATTDANGHFALTGVTPGGFDLMPRRLGEARTAIGSLDAAYALQAAVGTRVLTHEQALAADVTGNGSVGALDASRILQFAVGAVDGFAVSAICHSDWLFVPSPTSVPNQQSIEPAVASGQCAPGCIRYAPLTASASGQDFLAIAFGDVTGNWTGGGAADVAGPAPTVEVGPVGRLPNGRFRLPVSVSASQPFVGLELTLRYEPAPLRAVSARVAEVTAPALAAVHSSAPGRARLAAAGAAPLNPSGRATVLVTFDSSGSARALRGLRVEDVRAER